MPVHVDRAWETGEFIRVAADHPACRVSLDYPALLLHLLLAYYYFYTAFPLFTSALPYCASSFRIANESKIYKNTSILTLNYWVTIPVHYNHNAPHTRAPTVSPHPHNRIPAPDTPTLIRPSLGHPLQWQCLYTRLQWP